jgi:hypothetical protein
MAEKREIMMSGGCQCGSVRYALMSEPTHASILPLPHLLKVITRRQEAPRVPYL